MTLQFTHVGWIIHAFQTCYWRFEIRKALLNAPSGALSYIPTVNPRSNEWAFSWNFWIGKFPLTSTSYIKRTETSFLHFHMSSNFQRYHTFELPIPHTFFKIQNIPTLILSWDIFETSSLRYHRLSYTLVSANLYFLKHILFSSTTFLGHSLLLFFTYRIRSFHSRFV